MKNAQWRHDISDAAWADRTAGWHRYTRLVINAVSRILRTGAPQRDLPPEYGKWGTARRRFIRRRDEWIWEKPLEILINEPDFGRLMTDAGHRHLAENAFSHLGQWRGIAARYAKAPASLKA